MAILEKNTQIDWAEFGDDEVKFEIFDAEGAADDLEELWTTCKG